MFALLLALVLQVLVLSVRYDAVIHVRAPNALSGHQDGPGNQAQFNTPTGVACCADGTIIVADQGNHRLRAISPNGDVRTIAGTGVAGNC